MIDLKKEREERVANGQRQKYYGDGLQVIDFGMAVGLDSITFNILKYVKRAGKKDNKLDDISKAKWYCNFLITYLEETGNKWYTAYNNASDYYALKTAIDYIVEDNGMDINIDTNGNAYDMFDEITSLFHSHFMVGSGESYYYVYYNKIINMLTCQDINEFMVTPTGDVHIDSYKKLLICLITLEEFAKEEMEA